MVNQEPNKHIIGTKALVENIVHFGHKSYKRNPKMSKYIYAKKRNYHIIDLSKTLDKITEAYNFLKEQASKEDFQMIFVGTKPRAKKIVAEEAIRCGESFINERWLGGSLTNSKTINKRLHTWFFLEAQQKSGAFNKLTKKEAMLKNKEIEHLSKYFRGIRSLNSFPKVLFVVDIEKEKTAVKEAKIYNIPVIAIVNTNVDPTLVDYPIPANDENDKSINLITSLMVDAVIEGKKMANNPEYLNSELKFAYNKDSFKAIPKRKPVSLESNSKNPKTDQQQSSTNSNSNQSHFEFRPNPIKKYSSRFEQKMLGNNRANSFNSEKNRHNLSNEQVIKGFNQQKTLLVEKDQPSNLEKALEKSIHVDTAKIAAPINTEANSLANINDKKTNQDQEIKVKPLKKPIKKIADTNLDKPEISSSEYKNSQDIVKDIFKEDKVVEEKLQDVNKKSLQTDLNKLKVNLNLSVDKNEETNMDKPIISDVLKFDPKYKINPDSKNNSELKNSDKDTKNIEKTVSNKTLKSVKDNLKLSEQTLDVLKKTHNK